MEQLNSLDLTVIGVYFAVVLAIAGWAALRRKEKAADYFLSGRDAGFLVVAGSLFASNIGSEHLVGLAGSGARGGLAIGHFEWLAALVLLLLGWLFVPFYLKSGVYTMPEFLERRYNSASRWYFTSISIVAYVLTKISVALYAGGVLLQAVVPGLNLWSSAAIIVLITGAYTVVGGLRAVLYTDTLQAFVLIAGMTVVLGFGLAEVGGWDGLQERIHGDSPDVSRSDNYFTIWKPIGHPDLPWTGIVFGAPILGVWYWCTDQYIVQRVLSARGLQHARGGTIVAGWLKILPVFLFVVPGMIAVALYPEVREAPDRALPTLVLKLLPVGLRGFVIAALLAALMSSLSSIFNSTSTLVTWDFYKRLRPQASERTLILVGRLSTAVLVVLGLLWIPFMEHISSQLYIYLQSVQGYIAPPIAACFLLGLFIPRLNGAGAITCLLSGFVLGALRLVLELVNGREKDVLAAGSVWEWVAEINFLHFAALLFAVCTVLLVVVSLLTARPSAVQIAGLTWQTAEEAGEGGIEEPRRFEAGPSRRINVWLSVLLAATIVALWIVFA